MLMVFGLRGHVHDPPKQLLLALETQTCSKEFEKSQWGISISRESFFLENTCSLFENVNIRKL